MSVPNTAALEVLKHLLEGRGAPPHADSEDPLVRMLHQLYETKLTDGPGSSTFSFLATISHELRTPLNAIIGYSELILDDLEAYKPEALRSDVKRIHHAGRNLLGLIDEVVDVSRLESGTSKQLKETFELAQFVHKLIPTFQPVVQQRGNRFTWTVEPAVRLRTDGTKLRSVLRTLVNRAARVTSNGVVSIKTEQLDDEVTITVQDSGESLPKDLLDNPRSYSTGQGAGLATAARMVEVLGGRLEVDGSGEGTTFRVILPAFDLPTEDDIVPVPMAVEGDRVVLVIDDDPTVQDLVSRYLEPLGYKVVVATSGPAALRMAEAVVPALITLDVMMPEMDGWTTLARLKANPKLADVPVVMMSMVADDHASAVMMGASEYVVKPFDRGSLLNTVERFVGPKRRRVLVVDDEPDARELARRVLVSAGYLVDEVGDGRQALAYLEQQHPDLILLDLMMPELDGFGVIRALQEDPELSSIPLVVLTAMALTDSDRQQLALGARSVLTKGDPNSGVLERIAAALAL